MSRSFLLSVDRMTSIEPLAKSIELAARDASPTAHTMTELKPGELSIEGLCCEWPDRPGTYIVWLTLCEKMPEHEANVVIEGKKYQISNADPLNLNAHRIAHKFVFSLGKYAEPSVRLN